MHRNPRDDKPLAEQAAKWLSDLEHGDRHKQAEFAAWLKESPRHIEEVLCAAAIGKALDRLDPQRWPDVSGFLANPVGTVVPLAEDTSPPRAVRYRPYRKLWIAGITAATVCFALALILPYLTGWHKYATTVGEQRTLTLDDGSLACLNTHSQLTARFTSSTREVRLEDGEALFKVRRDPTRPFLVKTDDVVIRALGTQFNVYRKAEATVVSVVEGAVEVATRQGSQRLAAGEEARIAPDTVTQVRQVDVTRMATWRQRRLVFELKPLAEVAQEFNRYNREPRIRVEGHARSKRFSGIFDVDDPRSLMNLLATYSDLAVEEHDGEVVIQTRPVVAK